MKEWLDNPLKKKPKIPELKERPSLLVNNEKAADEFLASYILNRGWEIRDKSPKHISKADEDSDIDEIEKAEEFEIAFNRRFEEQQRPPSNQVIGHSRHMATSIRQDENSRKSSRKARAEKKEIKARIETEELKRLKVLKRREIESIGEKVATLSGQSNRRVVDLLGASYEENCENSSFDENEHDALMASLFNEEYYEAKEPLDSNSFISNYADNDNSDDDSLLLDGKKEKKKKESETSLHLKKEISVLENEYYKLHYEDKVFDFLNYFFRLLAD